MTPHGAKVRAGQERARRERGVRGVRIGRPFKIKPAVRERARAMRDAGKHLREIAAARYVSKPTLHLALAREVAP